jgi:hypothetical protein
VRRARSIIVWLLAAMAAVAPARAQLRVATWNMTFYSGGRDGDIAMAVYGEFEGRSLAPAILIAQEMLAGGPEALVQILNASGPGDWRAAPVLGSAGDSALFYRDSRVTLLDTTLVAPGGPSPRQPRDVVRWDVRLTGYQAEEATIAIYSSHMKAGTTAADSARRAVEARAIRRDAAELPEPWTFLVGGDLNMQRSSEEAWAELTDVQSDNRGRLFDPVNSPGTWRDIPEVRFLHTQDPAGPGGMDDRFDVILVCRDLLEGPGPRYIGDATQRFSRTTWDDPNHSYRAWGNDGASLKQPLRTTGNTMVGPVIAEALRQVAQPAGHLPVYLDLRVPARLEAPEEIDFGVVAAGEMAEVEILVGNGGEVGRWGAGIDDLVYRLEAPAPFTAPGRGFLDAAGAELNEHIITLAAPAPGPIEAELTITSNAPDDPVRLVRMVARVALCRADLDGDGALTFFDFLTFQDLFAAGDLRADFDGDGVLDFFDFLTFQDEFVAGC